MELSRTDKIEAAKLAAYQVMLDGWKGIYETLNLKDNLSLEELLQLARAKFWIDNDDKINEL